MKYITHLSAVITLALALCCKAQSYEPGKEYDVVLPGSALSVKLYVPADYTPDQQWPLVLFYHGMNGAPTTDCIARHCEGKGFIIVGMAYCETQAQQMTREQQAASIEKERQNFSATLGWVKANLAVDTARVFLGGISQGGWTTSFVGERELKRLAGFIILLAGRQRGAVPGPQPMNGFPVYIGAGESDPNLLSAVHGAGFYRQCGANLCFEEYAGLGHQAPTKAALLTQWLEAYGPLSHPWLEPSVKEARRLEYKHSYDEALAMPDKNAACRKLRALLDDPRLAVACGAATVKAIEQKLTALAGSDAQAARALAAERTFFELVWKEWNMKTFEENREIVEGYSRLSQAGSQTRYDGYAARSYERLLPMYQSSQKQLDQMKESQKKAPQKTAPRPTIRNSSGSGGMSVF